MKKKVLATLLLSLLVVPLVQSADQAPRLVVGITVDQLRTDYLMALQHLFGEKGFKRLMKEGVVCENLVYDYPNVDKASATATLYTGTMPFFHGIPSERFFNTTFQREEFILNDPSKIGNYTQETFSPERLKTSTISDEVKIVSGGLGRVYAVAPDAQQAIISAGHAGNCAFWINDRNGKWATTTYYRDVPAYIEQFNYGRSLSARIDTLAWTPVYTPDLYTAIPYLTNDFSFKRTFSHDNRDRFAQFKTTALVNREITDVAVEFLDKGLLGRRGVLDMLNVRYVIGPSATADDVATRPTANGAAWTVRSVVRAASPEEEITLTGQVDTKHEAVMSDEFLPENYNFTDGTVTLEEYRPNYLRYTTRSEGNALAVFSEIYTREGWRAYIDGEEVRPLRADYILRALELPAGSHTVEWRYRAPHWNAVEAVTLIFSIAVLAAFIITVITVIRNERRQTTEA